MWRCASFAPRLLCAKDSLLAKPSIPSRVQKSNLVRDRGGWETVASETHFETPHLTVATDEVRTPTQPAIFSAAG